ncbi:MAG: Hsp70 family protein [Planctomycetia bacterium]|nr:Hsp70 family protein [Planctomycetia bacterium]
MSNDQIKRVYGIDLGTTYSAISFINEHGKPEIITNSDNERITPSVVYFESLENIIVGKIAKESAKTDPDRVVDFVKRQMNNLDWTFEIEGESFRPEVISSFILKRLVGDAEKTGKHEVKDVVITCPAYFGDLERSRTRQAGELAGLNVVEILDEPVAAAIYYGLNDENAKGKNIIVYDLGGGTFDVTVVSIGNDPNRNEIKIVCTEGDHLLGGKDWDDAIFNYYDSHFQDETSHPSVVNDPETAYDLRLAAEKDKQTLTVRDKVSRRVFSEGEKVVVELTREKFDEMTENLLARTLELTESVLEAAKERGIEKIDAFLLVGGSTRMRQVPEKIIERFAERLGVSPMEVDVDEAVAKGAAIVGEFKAIQNYVITGFQQSENNEGEPVPIPNDDEIAQIADETGKTEEEIRIAVTTSIQKVATKSYGIKALKGDTEIIRNLITKQTNVPATGSQIFKTAQANAIEIDLIVYANNNSESDVPLDMGEEIGNAVFKLPQNLPDRSPIEITFNLSDEGKLSMTAVDQTFNQKVDAVFEAAGVMTEEEMEMARKHARNIMVD